MIQKSTGLKYEPSWELLRITAEQLFSYPPPLTAGLSWGTRNVKPQPNPTRTRGERGLNNPNHTYLEQLGDWGDGEPEHVLAVNRVRSRCEHLSGCAVGGWGLSFEG